MKSHLLPAVILTALAAVTACDGKPTEKKGAGASVRPESIIITARDCFPEGSRRWIPIEGESASVQAQRGQSATIYIDGSGSMAGYLRGGRRGERPFEELVNDIPGSVGADATQTAYVLFGKALHPVEGDALNTLSRISTYACANGQDCDNQESRLDAVLRDITAKNGNHLSVVITDLWLSNSDLATSGSTALNQPIQKLLASGQSIAIYGLDAPYEGRVYDLPSGRDDVSASRRPLYILAVGSSERLRRLDESLRQSPSPFIHQVFTSGDARRTLFTRTPETAAGAETTPFVAHPALRAGIVLRAREGLRVQQLMLSRSAARQARVAVGRPGATRTAVIPTWSGPDEAAIAPGAVWAGDLSVRTSVWRQKRESGACRASDWEDAGRFNGGWRSASEGTQRTFALDPALVADQLNPGTYLIVGEIARSTLTRPNPATAWMREWSFSPATEADIVADRPRLFPTLNLAETARLMENALADAGPESPSVAGFSVVIQVKN